MCKVNLIVFKAIRGAEEVPNLNLRSFLILHHLLVFGTFDVAT